MPSRAVPCDVCAVLCCALAGARVTRTVHRASVAPAYRGGGESDRDGGGGGKRGRRRGGRSTAPAEAGRCRQRGHSQEAHAGACMGFVDDFCVWCVYTWLVRVSMILVCVFMGWCVSTVCVRVNDLCMCP